MSFHIVSSSVLPSNVFASTIDALILSTLSYVTWLGHSSLKVHSLCHSFELAVSFSEVSPLGFVTHWVPCVLLSTSFIDTGESRFTGEYWTPWERGALVRWVPGALFLHL